MSPGEVTSSGAPTKEPWRFEPSEAAQLPLLPHRDNRTDFCSVCVHHSLRGDHCPPSTHSENWFSPCPKAGSSLVQWCLQPITSLPGQGFRTDFEGRCHWLTQWMTFWGASGFLGHDQPSWALKGSCALVFLRCDVQLQLILNVTETVIKEVIQRASQQLQEVTQHWQLNHGCCKHSLQRKHKKQITLVTAWIGFREIKVCWTCQGWALSQEMY